MSDSVPRQPGAERGAEAGAAARGAGPVRPGAPMRPERKLPANPRRVRGGVKLKKSDEEPSWVTQRWTRLIEAAADGDELREGLEYARLGQTKKLEIGGDAAAAEDELGEPAPPARGRRGAPPVKAVVTPPPEPGRVRAIVQGRMPKPYTVELSLPTFSAEERARVVAAMADQARYAAKLLAGELPRDIEDVFAPMGLHLFPVDESELTVSCTCDPEKMPEPSPKKVWCKHAVCVTRLVAQRLGEDPFLMFALRGLPAAELLESLRERRALGGQGPEPASVYEPRVAGATDVVWKPLEDEVESFWEAGGGSAAEVDLPLTGPEVSHPLLRRLGRSPFEGRFPLVGLLETCYSLISERVVGEHEAPDVDEAAEADADGPEGEPGGNA